MKCIVAIEVYVEGQPRKCFIGNSCLLEQFGVFSSFCYMEYESIKAY